MFSNYKKQYEELFDAVVGMGYEVKYLTGIELVKTVTLTGTREPAITKPVSKPDKYAKKAAKLRKNRATMRKTLNDTFYCFFCKTILKDNIAKGKHKYHNPTHSPILNATRLVNGKGNRKMIIGRTNLSMEDANVLAATLKGRV